METPPQASSADVGCEAARSRRRIHVSTHDSSRATSAVGVDDGTAAVRSSGEGQGRCCWVCCAGGTCPESGDELSPTGCGCRGSSGFAHLHCLVQLAVRGGDVERWTTCPTCGQYYTGVIDVGLAQARWQLVRDRWEHGMFLRLWLRVAAGA
jgi:hypothetical protein